MATLDTLPPDRRAIIELVLRQGRTYEEIADMLAMPGQRVRELAREALVSLSPASARRVDAQWRGQLADYVLGQQSGPESTATRGHLKRSEAARTWVASLLDSLDSVMDDKGRPAIPSAEDGGRPGRGRAGRGRRGGAPAAPAPAAEQREPAEETDPAEDREPAEEPKPPRRAKRRRGDQLSSGARAVVRRRRVLFGVLGTIALAGVVALAIVLLSGDEDETRAQKPAAGQKAGGNQARLLGQAPLQPVEGGKGEGVAVIAERGGQRQLLVQATGLRRTDRNTAYEVWLYNSPNDAVSVGAQFTDKEGQLQGAGPLPPDFAKYQFIDVSREPVNDDAKHSGDSVLRAPLDRALASGGADAGAAPGGQPPPGPGTP